MCMELSTSFLSEKKALSGKAAERGEKVNLNPSQALEYLTGHWAQKRVCGFKCLNSF